MCQRMCPLTVEEAEEVLDARRRTIACRSCWGRGSLQSGSRGTSRASLTVGAFVLPPSRSGSHIICGSEARLF